MSLVQRISVFHSPFPPSQATKSIPTRFSFPNSKTFCFICTSNRCKPLCISSITRGGGDSSDGGIPDTSDHADGSKVIDESGQTKTYTSNKLLKRLSKYGVSGILSYGLLNTVYYLTTFCIVWALALAPLVSKGLTWITLKFKFKSEGKAFMAIVGICLGLALLLFLLVTLLSA